MLLYAFQRLLPSTQYCFVAYANLKQYKPSTLRLLSFIQDESKAKKEVFDSILKRINDISFKDDRQNKTNKIGAIAYRKGDKCVYIDLYKGDLIKVDGRSGSGKSTFIDLIASTNYVEKNNDSCRCLSFTAAWQ